MRISGGILGFTTVASILVWLITSAAIPTLNLFNTEFNGLYVTNSYSFIVMLVTGGINYFKSPKSKPFKDKVTRMFKKQSETDESKKRDKTDCGCKKK